LPRLKNTDVYAPLGAARVTVAFEEARRQVLEAFDAFDPGFGALARTFFAERRIDAEPRPGKRLGAFCASLGPSANPFVLLGYRASRWLPTRAGARHGSAPRSWATSGGRRTPVSTATRSR